MIPLPALEDIIDRAGIAPRIELLLPIGVRARQLTARTLLLGMLLVLADHRPAHLTRVHHALVSLPEDDQRRLGVLAAWKTGPHLLTYRQTERTFGLAADALAKDAPDGLPSILLQRICDDLLEASIPGEFKNASTALAVDWTDMETFSRPPARGTSDCADPEASWGHRSGGGPGQDSELFFGYYPSAATMMRDEHGPPVPELARRMTVCSCRHDPARALVPVLTAMPGDGIPLGDILADSGYAHRDAGAWALPLRHSGAQLVQDLHPLDRGPRGTHHGAIIANGNLYCPATPRTLLELGPLARDATPGQAAAHDQQTAEIARYKLGRITTDDHDGYHRVMCPAATGKIRCPLRPASMRLDRNRPEILTPPGHPPACCTQQWRASHFPDCGSFRILGWKGSVNCQENTRRILQSSAMKPPGWWWKRHALSLMSPANSGSARPRSVTGSGPTGKSTRRKSRRCRYPSVPGCGNWKGVTASSRWSWRS
jgi:hypothetical protein